MPTVSSTMVYISRCIKRIDLILGVLTINISIEGTWGQLYLFQFSKISPYCGTAVLGSGIFCACGSIVCLSHCLPACLLMLALTWCHELTGLSACPFLCIPHRRDDMQWYEGLELVTGRWNHMM